MTDKMESDIRRGKKSAIILDDPVFKEAMDELEKLALEAMTTCAVDELQERRGEVVAIRKLRRILHNYISSGRIAQRTIAN